MGSMGSMGRLDFSPEIVKLKGLPPGDREIERITQEMRLGLLLVHLAY